MLHGRHSTLALLLSVYLPSHFFRRSSSELFSLEIDHTFLFLRYLPFISCMLSYICFPQSLSCLAFKRNPLTCSLLLQHRLPAIPGPTFLVSQFRRSGSGIASSSMGCRLLFILINTIRLFHMICCRVWINLASQAFGSFAYFSV